MIEGVEQEFPDVDESSFIDKFLDHDGVHLVLEAMNFCTSVSQWAAVDASIEVLATVLRRTRSNRGICQAASSKAIPRLMNSSFQAEHLSNAGRGGLEVLLRNVLPEVLLYRSVIDLARDLTKPTDAETRLKLLVSPYREEWNHLFDIYVQFRRSYESLEGHNGQKFDSCANVRNSFITVLSSVNSRVFLA